MFPSPVFLFNLHKDSDLEAIFCYKMQQRAKEAGELIEEDELEDDDSKGMNFKNLMSKLREGNG